MARSLSWLDRTVPIARTVQESARSHYDRRSCSAPSSCRRAPLNS